MKVAFASSMMEKAMFTLTIQAATRDEAIAKLAELLAGRREPVSPRVRDVLYERQKGRCPDCGDRLMLIGPAPAHADHIMPLALGGSNDVRNLQLLCAPCNLTKGARDPLDHARIQGRLI